MASIHARSIRYKVKKKVWVEATHTFDFQGHFQGQTTKKAKPVKSKHAWKF